jgi:hypothetical protein
MRYALREHGVETLQYPEALAQKEANKSLWRKSLESIIPWKFGAPADAEEDKDVKLPGIFIQSPGLLIIISYRTHPMTT